MKMADYELHYTTAITAIRFWYGRIDVQWDIKISMGKFDHAKVAFGAEYQNDGEMEGWLMQRRY